MAKGIRTWIGGVLVLVAVVVLYSYRSAFAPLFEGLARLWPGAPCTEPITFAIGSVDQRFGLSRAQLLDDVNEAAKVWGTPIDRTLFSYADDGKLKINLIYDFRQKATTDLQALGLTIKTDKESYDAIKAKYDALVAEHKRLEAELERHIAAFTEAKKEYERDATYWNDRGGAPKKEYNDLEARRQALNAEVVAINRETAEVNKVVENINSAATVLNRLVRDLNLNVRTYNTIGSSAGVEFDEGQYVRDRTGERIDIYQFENNSQLVRVLAHELGHALNLDHVDDPKAIMYRMNQNSTIKPTAADIAELKAACSIP